MRDYCIVADQLLLADCIANYFYKQPDIIVYTQNINEPVVSASTYIVVSDNFDKICKFSERVNVASLVVVSANKSAFFTYKLMLSGINVILDYTTTLDNIYEIGKQVPLYNRIQISPTRLHNLLERTYGIPKNDLRLMNAVYEDMQKNDRFFNEKFKLRLKNFSENYNTCYVGENSFFRFLLKYDLLMHFGENK